MTSSRTSFGGNMLLQLLSQRHDATDNPLSTYLVVVELSISTLGDSGSCQSWNWAEFSDILV